MEASVTGLAWSAGVRLRISSKVWKECRPSQLPVPPPHFIQRRSSRRAGADHPARWVGARGGGGLRARGPGAALQGAQGGGCVSVARRTGSAVPFLGGGGRGHGTAVARLVALWGSGSGEGGGWGLRMRIGGAGSWKHGAVHGGGGRGQGTAAVHVVAVGGVGAAGTGPLGVLAAPQGGGIGASERVRRGGAEGSRRDAGGSVVRGRGWERCRLRDGAPSWGESGYSGGVCQASRAPRGAAGYCWRGGEFPGPHGSAA